MIKTKCIKKIRDKNNRIVAYYIEDSKGKVLEFSSSKLKKAISNHTISVVNLTLTSDGRLVDTSDKVSDMKKSTSHLALVSNHGILNRNSTPREEVSSMLTVYLNVNNAKEKIITINDAYFNSHVNEIDFYNAEIADIMMAIDGAVYKGNGFYQSKYNNQVISMSNLSTGCKTLINIVSFTDIIFDVSECGENAFDYIFQKLVQGNICIRFGYLPKSINQKIKVVTAQEKISVSSRSDFERILDAHFGEGN